MGDSKKRKRCHGSRAKRADLYEVTANAGSFPAGVRLRTTPDSATLANVLQVLPPTLLVRRLDRVVYPDAVPNTGVLFFRVAVSAKPPLQGFAAFQQPIDAGVQILLAKTASALATERQLRVAGERDCRGRDV